MREIRPYGSEGGGGETLPTPICSRWLRSASDDTTGTRCKKNSCTPAGLPASLRSQIRKVSLRSTTGYTL